MTESDLKKFFHANPPARQFVPYTYYSKESDTLTIYFSGDPDYSERIDDRITLFRSMETDEIVGCRVDGVTHD